MIRQVPDDGLVCFGCAHCEANVEFPGAYSQAQPCFFCKRNPDLVECLAYHLNRAAWYDGSLPVDIPMDCYASHDMMRQIRAWEEKAWGRSG